METNKSESPAQHEAPQPSLSELIRREMTEDFSDKLSMQEISNCAYRIANAALSTSSQTPPMHHKVTERRNALVDEFTKASNEWTLTEFLTLKIMQAEAAQTLPSETPQDLEQLADWIMEGRGQPLERVRKALQLAYERGAALRSSGMGTPPDWVDGSEFKELLFITRCKAPESIRKFVREKLTSGMAKEPTK